MSFVGLSAIRQYKEKQTISSYPLSFSLRVSKQRLIPGSSIVGRWILPAFQPLCVQQQVASDITYIHKSAEKSAPTLLSDWNAATVAGWDTLHEYGDNWPSFHLPHCCCQVCKSLPCKANAVLCCRRAGCTQLSTALGKSQCSDADRGAKPKPRSDDAG